MSEQTIAHYQPQLVGVERLVVCQIIAFSFSFQVTIRFTIKNIFHSKRVRIKQEVLLKFIPQSKAPINCRSPPKDYLLLAKINTTIPPTSEIAPTSGGQCTRWFFSLFIFIDPKSTTFSVVAQVKPVYIIMIIPKTTRTIPNDFVIISQIIRKTICRKSGSLNSINRSRSFAVEWGFGFTKHLL